ncbi:MAG: phage minor head protein [Candidatus Wallbacteria bacterium]
MAGDVNLKFAFGLEPKDAVTYFEAKGYKVSFDWRSMLHEAHNKAFTVAGVTKLEVLKSIRESVDKAIKDGITLEQFKKDLKPKLQKQGWWGAKEVTDEATGKTKTVDLSSPWRLKTIFGTNVQVAYSAGRYKQLMENIEFRPLWKYVAIIDGSTRPAHKALNGKIFRYDDPVWNHIYPPNDWHCRCSVQALRQKDISGDEIETIDDYKIEQRNVKGVDTSRIKFNDGNILDIGAGWDYNPGKASWEPDLSKYDAADLKAYHNEQKIKAGTEFKIKENKSNIEKSKPINKPEISENKFQKWFKEMAQIKQPQKNFEVIGKINNKTVEFLNSKNIELASNEITLSDEKIIHLIRDAKKSNNKTIPVEQLIQLPEILKNPDKILFDSNKSVILFIKNGQGNIRYKIILHINWYERKGSRRIVTNLIKSGSIIKEMDIKSSNYEIIKE